MSSGFYGMIDRCFAFYTSFGRKFFRAVRKPRQRGSGGSEAAEKKGRARRRLSPSRRDVQVDLFAVQEQPLAEQGGMAVIAHRPRRLFYKEDARAIGSEQFFRAVALKDGALAAHFGGKQERERVPFEHDRLRRGSFAQKEGVARRARKGGRMPKHEERPRRRKTGKQDGNELYRPFELPATD